MIFYWLKIAVFFGILVLVTIRDLQDMIIPDRLIITGVAAGFCFMIFFPSWIWLEGALIGFGVMWIIYQLSYLLTKDGGMGYGDVKLAGMIGLYVGFPGIINALVIAYIAGGVFCIGLLIITRRKRMAIPFAPFLAVGGVATMVSHCITII